MLAKADHTHDQIPEIGNYFDRTNMIENQVGNDNIWMDERTGQEGEKVKLSIRIMEWMQLFMIVLIICSGMLSDARDGSDTTLQKLDMS